MLSTIKSRIFTKDISEEERKNKEEKNKNRKREKCYEENIRIIMLSV